MRRTTTFNLPHVLTTRDNGTAQRYLEQYYADGLKFTGSAFDTWDSTGTRDRDANRFTADDLGQRAKALRLEDELDKAGYFRR